MHDANSHQQQAQVDDAFVAEIAREADADPRTVIRRLAGLPCRSRVGRRIDRIIAAKRLSAAEASR